MRTLRLTSELTIQMIGDGKKQCGVILALLMLCATSGLCAGAPPFTFYIQLVRGTDQDTPPAPQAQLIGAKLGDRLHGVFKWKNYWEIKRESVTLKTGEKMRKRMSDQKEVEIKLVDPTEMEVSIYSNGKLSRKRTQPVETGFYIAGGDRTDTQSWFIVVRRDNPAAVTQ